MEIIKTLGKYEIKRLLGRGAMGTVYEGWDPIIARRVAIKTVHLPHTSDPEIGEALARFRREAQAAGRLNHPNIVGVFDYGETNDAAYIVMEFIDGAPLKSILDRQERFALADTVHIMEDLLAGLQFSHERGVVHRDIKAANVILTGGGRAKIADFGIARIESSSMTQAGTVLGTPAYMSPEQFMGQVVDARTDIYSSGVLLYQLLSGERPFDGGMSAVMHKALTTDPPAPSQLSVTAPPPFDAVVRRAMAKRPEDRYRSAKDFAEAIRTALSGTAELASEDEATTVVPSVWSHPGADTPKSPPGRHSSVPLIVTGSVVLLAMLVSIGAWFLLRAPAETQMPAPKTNMAIVASPVPAPTPVQDTSIQPPPTAAPPPNATSQNLPPVPAPVSSALTSPSEVAPASPPPPVTNPQIALAGLDAMRRQIAQYIATRRCVLIGGDISDNGSVAFFGLAGSSVVDGLRQSIDGITSPNDIDWRVNGVDPVFCPALDALHPAMPTFGNGGFQLGLQMAGGKTRLRDGEPIRLQLVMPSFTSWLRVDYIANDKSVQHLYPQRAEQKNAIKADLPRPYGAGEPIDLGDPAWLVGPPYGTDMVIAVASSEPLFSHPRPRNEESAEIYLRDLQAAINNAAQHGARLAGVAMILETLPATLRR
jgi:serine/threonine protein kinase